MDQNKTIGIDFIERLSGGNHELFHSNLLAFLAEHEPEFFRKLFECSEYDSVRIGREDNNLDLCLYEKGSDKIVLVIENKMKSRPSKAQLRKYIEKNKNNFADNYKLVLLTLFKPTWKFDEHDKKWEVFTYKKLIERLNCFLTFNSFKSREYLDKFIKDYILYVGEVESMANGLKKQIVENDPTFDQVKNIIKNDKVAWTKSFTKKAFSLASLEYLSELCGNPNLDFDIIENNRGIFGVEVLIPLYSKYIDNYKDKDNETKEGSVMYFINLQGKVLSRGFRIYTEDSQKYKGRKRAILKGELTERGEFLIKIWNEVLKSTVGTEISKSLKKYDIDLSEYGNGKNFHAYIFDDFAMPYLTSEEIPDERKFKEVLEQMKEEILMVNNICEKFKP